MQTPTAISPTPPRVRLRWWREALYIGLFYGIYSVIRNQFGSASVDSAAAYENARRIIDLEKLLGTFHEETVQEVFLSWRGFIQFWNLFYGTFHFVVTIFCMVWLFKRFPDLYVRWRTTLAVTTALALVGFAFFPLMPPRLLPESFGFVDTVTDVGGLWSFDSGAMHKISNQYAAMPSLHFAWAAWCTFVLVPTTTRTWAKALAISYPILTLFAVVVTANHYWLDAAGGALALAIGWVAGRWWDRRTVTDGA